MYEQQFSGQEKRDAIRFFASLKSHSSIKSAHSSKQFPPCWCQHGFTVVSSIEHAWGWLLYWVLLPMPVMTYPCMYVKWASDFWHFISPPADYEGPWMSNVGVLRGQLFWACQKRIYLISFPELMERFVEWQRERVSLEVIESLSCEKYVMWRSTISMPLIIFHFGV